MLTTQNTSGADVGRAALLLLSDGRFPAGGHAHSGGIEAAVECGAVYDVQTLERFLRGRLSTTGRVAAAFAAATCAACRRGHDAPGDTFDLHAMRELDAELDARIPSPALRAASRKLGRQLLRAAREVFPRPGWSALTTVPAQGLHHAVALGAVTAAAALTPAAAALAAAYDSTAGPATATVRLLGLDPFAVHAVLARVSTHVDAIAAEGAGYADLAPADLPACNGPLLDIRAEQHATWEVRLFAS